MSPTRTKPKKKKAPAVPTAPAAERQTTAEVFTLADAAAYLRVTEDEIIRLAQKQGLPGRLLKNEWRFLKSAIEDWLRTPPAPGTREAVMSVAGIWKDDPYIEEELKEIYRRRGRPMTEDGE